MKRVGFIINSRLPSVRAIIRRGMLPHHLLTGWNDAASPMSLMRFRWIAEAVNKESGIHYELYKPWRRYDTVVLVKSMGHDCIAFAQRAKNSGVSVIFDANVDYYTVPEKKDAIVEALPSEHQHEQARKITALADGVMASSRHLAEICSQYSSSKAAWIPDNVNFSLVPQWNSDRLQKDGPLPVWWSGMPQKLFEFLRIETALRKHAEGLHLHLVTRSLSALKQWPEEMQKRFKALLHEIPHTIHSFVSVEELLKLYTRHGGIVISPRFLDTPYNFGHSEWKITLAMACGLPAVCSPVPSYKDVANRADPSAIRICWTDEDWDNALSSARSGAWDIAQSADEAVKVVKKFYSTEVVAKKHLEFVTETRA